MLSSLGIGSTRSRDKAPEGSTAPFLSVGRSAPKYGAADVAGLAAAVPGVYVPGTSIPSANVAEESPGVSGLGAGPSGVGQFGLSRISEGRFTAATIEKMHQAVKEAKTDAKWRALIEEIRRVGRENGAIGYKDYAGEMAWFDHFYRNLRPMDYVRDPHQVELVMHPWHVFDKKLGDCDDLSALFAASMGAIGAPHRFRTYKADPSRPGEFTHVSAQIFVPGRGWVNEDLTLPGVGPGFEPKGFETKDWEEPRW